MPAEFSASILHGLISNYLAVLNSLPEILHQRLCRFPDSTVRSVQDGEIEYSTSTTSIR